MSEVEEIELQDQAIMQIWKERIRELERVAKYDKPSYKEKVSNYTKCKKYLASLQALNKKIARRKPTPFALIKEIKELMTTLQELKGALKP